MEFETSRQYLRSEFALLSVEQISNYISVVLSRRKPASIIRLGDGEGAALARPTPDNKILWSTMIAHFGPQVTPEFVEYLADGLIDAIDCADIIGVRDDLMHVEFPESGFELAKSDFVEKFKSTFNLRNAEKDIAYPGALRLALMHRFLVNHRFSNKMLFGSAWMHFVLSESGVLARLISGEKKVGLITSKTILTEQIESLLDTEVDGYHIPDMYQEMRKATNQEYADQLPAKLTQIMDSFKVDFQGQLFLVGAGIMGKIYCNRLKDLGGIALDIGAVCDAWVGISTRRLVFETLFDQVQGSVPKELLLKYQIDHL